MLVFRRSITNVAAQYYSCIIKAALIIMRCHPEQQPQLKEMATSNHKNHKRTFVALVIFVASKIFARLEESPDSGTEEAQ
jgi:hypothetical protein